MNTENTVSNGRSIEVEPPYPDNDPRQKYWRDDDSCYHPFHGENPRPLIPGEAPSQVYYLRDNKGVFHPWQDDRPAIPGGMQIKTYLPEEQIDVAVDLGILPPSTVTEKRAVEERLKNGTYKARFSQGTLNERKALAAAIEANQGPLPPFLGRLIENAPETFLDARAGEIAVIIRAMRSAGEPVNFEIVGNKCLPMLNFICLELAAASSTLEDAEFYAGKCWAAYQIRRAKTVADDLVNGLNAAPDQAEDIIAHVQNALNQIRGEAGNDLPDLIDAATFIAERIEPPAELVEGLLHKGSKLVFGGSSKSFKTWSLLDLAISVATGTKWIQRQTSQGKVLFLNFEIQPHAWQSRIVNVAHAKGVQVQPGQIILWNLRGHAADFKVLIPRIIAKCRAENFALIVLDPIYKLYGNTDENSAGNVALLLNALEALATETGAAIAFGAHFAKGNASGKEAIDRISGSGVFARDPDSLLIFTKHENDDAFVIEPILRNFAPVEPFAVRWEFPLMYSADDLDPGKLKQANAGRKKAHDPKKLLAAIGQTTRDNPISISAWASLTKTPRNTLSDYLPEMRRQKWIETTGEGNTGRQFITNEGKAFIHAN